VTVARLVCKGYTARTPVKHDRRGIALTLTASGKCLEEQNTVLNPALAQNDDPDVDSGRGGPGMAGLERMARRATIQVERSRKEKDR